MALDSNIRGRTGEQLDVDTSGRALAKLPNASTPEAVGSLRIVSENDAGSKTGTAYLLSPETDSDSRLRMSSEAIFDCETFNCPAQNTGKFALRTQTLTNAFTAAGMVTNSGNITTVGASSGFTTWAEFPLLGASVLYCEVEGSFTAAPTTNTLIDFGLCRLATTTPYAPGDGVYFRLSSAGLLGVINANGTEITVSLGFSYTLNQKYQFIIAVHERDVRFWIDGVLCGTIQTPAGQGQPCMSASLPFAVRHAIVGGAAGAAISFVLNDYTVSVGGPNISLTASILGQRIYGSYQGLSGGTMGSLATYPNSTNAVAATPTNTALTANLPSGLGGQGAVNAQAAAAIDFIFASYQVPLGAASVQGRRLVVRGIVIDAVNMGAAVATTPTTLQLSIAFGHTSMALNTGESASVKAPRRIAAGFMNWPVGAPIGAGPDKGQIVLDFGDAPIFVNPGEYLQLVGKFLNGTATASQVINFTWQPIYGWE